MIFFKQFLKSAKHTGAIAPSTPFLAKKMVSLAKVKSAKTIVELGPGSGAITKEILKVKPKDCRLITVEINGEFVKYLEEKYPNAEHVLADISHLREQLRTLNVDSVDVIISGIPFVDFKKEECDVMLGEIDAIMQDEARFVLFTYTPIKFKTFFKWFEKVKLAYVPLNIPPAYVLALKKKR